MAGTLLTLAGLAALSGGARSLGTVGWSLIAAGIATIAVAWLAAAAGPAA